MKTRLEQAKWLDDFAALIERNPSAFMTYTTSDDGVWLSYGPKNDDAVNVGWSHDATLDGVRAEAQKLREESHN